MSSLLIKNAYAVLPHGVSDRLINILVTDGVITSVDHTGDLPNNTTVLDLNGDFLVPGFIDVHVHGGGGADFMDATVDAFDTVAKAHLAHGTTSLLATSMTSSTEELEDFIKAYKQYKTSAHSGAKILGLHFEGPYLSGASGKSKGAQKGEYLRHPDMDEMKKFLKLCDGDMLRCDIAPELPDALKLVEFLTSNGVICSMAHSSATSEQAFAGIEAGFSHVTHCYNAVTTYHKADDKVNAGIVEAAYLTENVSIELICDGCHIPRDILRLALKVKGPEMVMGITDAMRMAGTDMTEGYLGNTKSGSLVISDAGVAKLMDKSSFAGSICTTDRALRVLCRDYGIDIATASKMLSLAPAKFLGINDNYGTIENGKVADLNIVDKNFSVKGVILNGEKVV